MTEVTGIDVLRAMLKARNKTPHALSLIARDVGASASSVEDFSQSKADLDVATLKKISKLLCDADFDPDANRLVKSPSPPPRSLGVRPPAYVHARHHPPQVDPSQRGGIVLPKTAKSSGRIARPPGWA